ncbi:helix-turn-helix domain-containing protein [Domibacillus epiphyticus]|uniref:HTH cro/C1-type domain-containing protein n=1 Tax=Domibacillus epiphyticus TaxID=1714355 RepID=A0A1V2ABF4_9BACI|nr:helix-turn-helix transcriptional regulator [Domibacillus epiphyticus]OMP68328.1 hypothetical protein BTO28_02330 [Domibacillus epiphyticus]
MRKLEVQLLTLKEQKKPGISLRKIAEDINESRETVRKLANNEIERLPRSLIVKLCDYFDCEVSDLFKLTENE